MISRAAATAIVPALVLAGFVFVNIPVPDAHLSHKYGAEFTEYARRKRKLIPLVYWRARKGAPAPRRRENRESCAAAAGAAALGRAEKTVQRPLGSLVI